jgi:RNA polymerase sigma factor (sigma-70 family)
VYMPSTLWTTILQFHSNPDRVMEFVVHRYRQPVVEFCRFQGLSPEDAEDVAQEVFIRICSEKFLSKADQIRTRFRTVLLAVTNRVIISLRRRDTARIRDRRRSVSLDGADIPTESPQDSNFDRLWVKNLVEQALESLDQDPAVQALRLHLKGESYQQIAEALGKKATDVTNYLHRARKQLRQEIERLVAEYSPREDIAEEIAALRRFL